MRGFMGAAVLAGCLAAGGAMAAGGTTAWETTANQDACVENGSRAVATVGFQVTVSNDRQTVFGWRGDDLLAIRCIGDRNLAVFFLYTAGNNNSGDATMSSARAAFRQSPGMGGGGIMPGRKG
ncbi:hypothetical protein [Muricoccus radiodurans]|uniref:hypothetical protein n=1 Tax=Muricoccus radiodurans TaxID=2231721 RepID=UPI003CECC2AB